MHTFDYESIEELRKHAAAVNVPYQIIIEMMTHPIESREGHAIVSRTMSVRIANESTPFLSDGRQILQLAFDSIINDLVAENDYRVSKLYFLPYGYWWDPFDKAYRVRVGVYTTIDTSIIQSVATTPLRPLALVTLKEEYCNNKNIQIWQKRTPMIYLGEVPNMPGHGVFVDHTNKGNTCILHIEQYRELLAEET